MIYLWYTNKKYARSDPESKGVLYCKTGILKYFWTFDSRIPTLISIFLHFHSDSSDTGTGFKLEYSATSKNQYTVRAPS